MTYATRFRRRQYVKGSMWIAPLLGAVAASALALATSWMEQRVTLPEVWRFSSETASTVLSMLAGASISLIGSSSP
jgi:hypothetical protein